MKYTLNIDKDREEEIQIFAHSKNDLICDIERIIFDSEREHAPLVGYVNEDAVIIDPEEVYCFFLEDKKLYALLERGKIHLKMRLYEIEERLGNDFIKINQSSVANINKISRFSVSSGATLKVHFKNGHVDYVSRRQVRFVKERLGF